MAVSAVLDACVLYPVGLRDTLLNIAEAGFYHVLWTAEILEETSRNIVHGPDGRRGGRCQGLARRRRQARRVMPRPSSLG